MAQSQQEMVEFIPYELVQECRWFLLCENEATTTRSHPRLGAVPICERCDEKIARLMCE